MTPLPGRRLVLHLGLGKTGSSALQVALVRNRDLLQQHGVLYPAHTSDPAALRGEVVSGNGMALRPWLCGRAASLQEVGEGIAELTAVVLASQQATVVYSSEFLCHFVPDHLEALGESLAAHDVTLSAVLYVRDLVGHAFSSYAQVVKRALYTGSLLDFVTAGVEQGYHLPLRKLVPLARILGHGEVTVVHYDSVRERLVEDFLERVLGLAHLAELELTAGPVNRSLTMAEIDVVRTLNAGLQSRAQAHRLSNVLVARAPYGPTTVTVPLAVVDELRGQFGAQVGWINRRFLRDSALAVETAGIRTTTAAEPAPTWSERERFLGDLLVRLATSG